MNRPNSLPTKSCQSSRASCARQGRLLGLIVSGAGPRRQSDPASTLGCRFCAIVIHRPGQLIRTSMTTTRCATNTHVCAS